MAHSLELTGLIREEISAAGGAMGFDRFMSMALYQPGLGYYSAGSGKLGAAGDFVTAPEISPLFSQCLARQCMEIMQDLSQPLILELGAGTGVMARDMLLELERQESLPRHYWILETSADLRSRQEALFRASIAHLLPRIAWLDSLPETPFEGIVLANEVLDALPVRRFVLKDEGIREQGVALDGEDFAWTEMDADGEFQAEVRRVLAGNPGDYPPGYCSEINTALGPWLQSLAACLEKGVMLLADYGYPRREYYHVQRSEGTLLCHFRHRVHADPLLHIGLQDISAAVDFTAVAEAAVGAGLAVQGYTTQAFFLFGCGLEQLLLEKRSRDEREQLELGRQVKILTLPGEMGEQVKVIALAREQDAVLSGFKIVDHRIKL